MKQKSLELMNPLDARGIVNWDRMRKRLSGSFEGPQLSDLMGAFFGLLDGLEKSYVWKTDFCPTCGKRKGRS